MSSPELIQPVIQGICEHARNEGGTRVTRVCLKVGRLLGFRERDFREQYNLLSRGTILEKSRLELIFFPGDRIDVVAFDMK